MAYVLAMSDRIALARAIAARSKARFVEIQRQRGGGRIVLRSADLLAIKQGRRAEQERDRLIREWGAE
jgi:hypothetical protein